MLTESDRRTSVEVHPGGVVYIAEVGEQHEGRYTCMAVTATDLLERSVWVTIKEPCMLSKYPWTKLHNSVGTIFSLIKSVLLRPPVPSCLVFSFDLSDKLSRGQIKSRQNNFVRFLSHGH